MQARMKPLLLHKPSSNNNISILFFTVALLVISINVPTCVCDDHDQYTNCNADFSCEGSSISGIRYPFWGRNRESYCGGVTNNHDMELTCESSSVPMITFNDVKYRILNWVNTTQMLTVARDDYWDGNICDADQHKNSTFDNPPFQRGDDIANVTLLYNCDESPANRLYSINCNGGNSTRVVYTPLDQASYSRFCNYNPTAIVVIPLLGASQLASTTLVGSNINKVINEGFGLKYTGEDFAECGRCVSTGGVCGNDGGKAFKCFSQKASSSSSSKLKFSLLVTGGSLVGFGVTIFFIVIVVKRGICGQKRIFWKRGKFVDYDVKAFMHSYDLFVAKRYNYVELKRITNSFRDKVGQGGYGVVYKGCLPDGRLVAVKVISESKGSGEDFINEVASIGRTSHMNIVSLLGFCYEVNKRALIFEFMPNGSLDKFIYRSGIPNAICDFDWNTLFQIAISIARGLEYLHQGCIAKILHLDIKPQNILLDEDFCPKISDFGLAKICQKKDSIVSIPGTRGTIGYMAPEVFSRAFGGVSHKSDVYSYGMLILEMIGGRNNHDTGGSHTTEMYFPDWIYKDLEEGNTLASCLTVSEEENEIVRKITMVSLWCIQTNPSDRPSMKKVIDLLEGPLQSVPHPPKPVLYSPERPVLQISSMSSGSLYETHSITT